MRQHRLGTTTDRITVLYLLALILLVFVARGGILGWHWLFLRYLALLLVQGAVILARGRGLSQFLGAFFPLVPVLVIFDSLSFIPGVNPRDRDDLLVRLDRVLFGGDPSLWLEAVSSPWLTELFQLAYLVYYVLPFLILGALYRRREDPDEPGPRFDVCMVALLLSHYLAFVGYMSVPALGPRFALAGAYRTELTGLLLADPVKDLLNLLEGVKRDAFPSGHTSAALVSLFYAFRFAPRLARYALPAVALMVLATVYLRYHYVVDVLAGGLLAGLCVFLAGRLVGAGRAEHQTGPS